MTDDSVPKKIPLVSRAAPPPRYFSGIELSEQRTHLTLEPLTLPSDLPPDAYARIELEHQQARREFNGKNGQLLSSSTGRAASLRYIVRLFDAFSVEAHEMGRRKIWMFQQVQSQSLEMLNELTWSFSRKPNWESSTILREIETTEQWAQHENRLELLATGGNSAETGLGNGGQKESNDQDRVRVGIGGEQECGILADDRIRNPWLTEPLASKTDGNNSAGPQHIGDEATSKRPTNYFSDPEINERISIDIAGLQARIHEANAEYTFTDRDSFLVETMMESLDIHAGNYLRKVTNRFLAAEYSIYLRRIGFSLLRNAEERSHLRDPYSEECLRQMAESTGSLIQRRFKLTGDEYEREVQTLVEKCRTAMRPKAVEWHACRNQIVARISSRLEARFLHWSTAANSQLLIRPEADPVVEVSYNSGSEPHDQILIHRSSETIAVNKAASEVNSEDGRDPVLEGSVHVAKDSVVDHCFVRVILNPPSTVAQDRRRLLTAFKEKGRNLNIRITDVMIAKAAKQTWNERTMITWWKRTDPRCNAPHDRLIRNVLEKDPALLWARK